MRSIGESVGNWVAPKPPDGAVMDGRLTRLERLDPARHADQLHAANRADDAIWDYLPYGPFADAAAYRDWVTAMAAQSDPFFYAIVDKASGRALGVASYLRITPTHGVIEVGHICLSPALQRTVAATEAMFLMADRAFTAGYRRYEWKCNSLNMPSRRAAQRLGFSWEGVFRQHMVIGGRNRDSAWFAMTDKDWMRLKGAYLAWLDPANFGPDGRQKQSLADLTRPHLVLTDPALAANG